MSKIRLDQYLCQNGLVQSRERAKALIMSGIVFVNEQKVDKAGEMIAAVGATGMATGPHLHFEVRQDGSCVDPETALG